MKAWTNQWFGDELHSASKNYAKILSDVDKLALGQELSLNIQGVPDPLIHLFSARFSNSVHTETTRGEDGTWTVKVKRVSSTLNKREGCCGICGGD